MKPENECTNCSNQVWAEIWEDNFICQKCRQKHEREEQENTAEQTKN